VAEGLPEDLQRTAAQSATLSTRFGEADTLRAGDLWRLAADLQDTLTGGQLRDNLEVGTLSQDEFFDRLRSQRQALRTDVRAVLPPDHRARLDALRGKGAQFRPEHKQARQEALNLTASQQAELRILLETTLLSVQSVVGDVREGDIDRSEAREALRPIREETRSAAQDILSDEQWELVQVSGASWSRRTNRRGGPAFCAVCVPPSTADRRPRRVRFTGSLRFRRPGVAPSPFISFDSLRPMTCASKTPVLRISLILALFGLTLSLPAAAQQPNASPEQRQERIQAQFDSLATHLTLSDEQTAAVKPILRESLEKRMARLEQFRDNNENKSRRAKRRAARSLRKDLKAIDENTEKRLEKRLTDEQMTAYLEYREEQREEMRDPLRSRRGN
jgi:hypothetical protein